MNFLSTIRFGASGAILAAACTASSADTAISKSFFRKVAMERIEASSIFASPSPVVVPFGMPLKLPLKTTQPVRTILEKGIQLRIFRLGSDRQLPQALAIFEPCLVFLGVASSFKGSNYVEINVGFLDDLSWLTLSSNGEATNGFFRLVVEPLGNENEPFVRVDRAHIASYFQKSIILEVTSPKNISAKAVTDHLAKTRDAWANRIAQAKKNDKGLDCIATASIHEFEALALSESMTTPCEG